MQFTKFPGGGLEFGESTKACLEREFLEEFDVRISVLEHFYTTDFFVRSTFDPSVQVINVYYKVTMLPGAVFPEAGVDGQITLWIPVEELHEEMVTFPIEKKVVQLLINEKVNRGA